jgi:hypothetical protein
MVKGNFRVWVVLALLVALIFGQAVVVAADETAPSDVGFSWQDSPIQTDAPPIVIQQESQGFAYEWGFVAALLGVLILALLWHGNQQSTYIQQLSNELKEMVPPEAIGVMQKFALDALLAGAQMATDQAAKTPNKLDDQIAGQIQNLFKGIGAEG